MNKMKPPQKKIFLAPGNTAFVHLDRLYSHRIFDAGFAYDCD